MKNSTPSELPQLLLHTKFVPNIPNRKKISNKHFNLCETEISLGQIIKSINSETNKKPPGIMMVLQQNFINTFQIN